MIVYIVKQLLFFNVYKLLQVTNNKEAKPRNFNFVDSIFHFSQSRRFEPCKQHH